MKIMSILVLKVLFLLFISRFLSCETNSQGTSKIAKPGDYPWQVSVQFEGYGHLCIGTLITLQHVFTTASCVRIGVRILEIYGRIIAGDLSTKLERNPNRQIGYFTNITIHPEYDCQMTNNNAAVIQANEPFTATKYVHPVKVGRYNPKPFTICDITGWPVSNLTYPNAMNPTFSDIHSKRGRIQTAKLTVLYNEACGWFKEKDDLICLEYDTSRKGSICPRLEGASLTCNRIFLGMYTGTDKCDRTHHLYRIPSIPFYRDFIVMALTNKSTYHDHSMDFYVLIVLLFSC
ncbi:serine protease 27-like [Hermetia illucens]|uniref:serine protease 27-like n=1 Tax=Hermetia illucens TaxID=343691 RepID=UPI0018CC58ED|nr:serine protease 27-like [Hermetia illucens]